MTRDPRVGDPVSLALLAAVAATGSIGAAARRQGLSQPAASARLRELENAIGAALLDRTPTGSRPTSTGALIIEWAQPLLLAADTFHAALDTLQPRPTRGDTRAHRGQHHDRRVLAPALGRDAAPRTPRGAPGP